MTRQCVATSTKADGKKVTPDWRTKPAALAEPVMGGVTNMLGKKSIIKKVAGVVNGDTKIQAGDILVLFGLAKDIQRILEM